MGNNIKHDFGEQPDELQTPAFVASRNKAIEMIDSGKYGLSDADFWILKTRARNGKIAYKSLIISHNGCLKINSKLPEEMQFKSAYLGKPERSLFGNGVILEYDDGKMREYGEVSPTNCRSEYPMATLLKRVMDRVILKKSELAYSGIFSEVEAEEFSKSSSEEKTVNQKDNSIQQTTTETVIDSETGEVLETKDSSKPVSKHINKPVQVQATKPQQEHERLIDAMQISKVKSLYSAVEIQTMLGRMKLSSINDVTMAQAERMIQARTIS